MSEQLATEFEEIVGLTDALDERLFRLMFREPELVASAAWSHAGEGALALREACKLFHLALTAIWMETLGDTPP